MTLAKVSLPPSEGLKEKKEGERTRGRARGTTRKKGGWKS